MFSVSSHPMMTCTKRNHGTMLCVRYNVALLMLLYVPTICLIRSNAFLAQGMRSPTGGSSSMGRIGSGQHHHRLASTTVGHSDTADTTDYDVIIVGGAIAGMALGAALTRQDPSLRVCIYEKAHALRPIGAAIGLFPNGFRALREIGGAPLEEQLLRSCVDMRKAVIKDEQGKVLMENDLTAATGDGPSSVLPKYLVWYLLQHALADMLPDGVVHLGRVVDSFVVNEKDNVVQVKTRCRDDNTETTATCRVLVGADGIHSTIRDRLFADNQRPKKTYSGQVVFRTVMDMDELDDKVKKVIPPTGQGTSFKSDENGRLFSLRETAPAMNGRGPLLTITAMTFLDQPRTETHSTKEWMKDLFLDYPDGVRDLIDGIPESRLLESYVYDIGDVDEWSKGPVVLIGDAAHAMPPSLGQGANQGLEDACELAPALITVLQQQDDKDNNLSEEIEHALQTFWRLRTGRVNKIHSAARAQTQMINKSTKQSKSLASAFQYSPELLKEIYDWVPSWEQQQQSDGKVA